MRHRTDYAAGRYYRGCFLTERWPVLHRPYPPLDGVAGSAPKFATKVSRSGVPVAGILLTGVVGLFGVVLNFFVPEQAFEVVLNIASVGTMAGWAAIAMSHQKYLKLVGEGSKAPPTTVHPAVVSATGL